MNEAALRAYLLGKLTESEAELVENRLLEDPDLFGQLEVAEDDLFDAYARGELDADQSQRFLERFGGDRDRRRFAKAFIKRNATGRVIPFPRRYWMPLAIAATLLLGLYVAPWGHLQPQNLPAVDPARPVSEQPPSVIAPSMIHVPLTLGTSRASAGATRVTIDGSARLADLSIRLNQSDRFAAYGVEVRSPAGLIIWGELTLKAATENGDLILHAIVPADRLVAGTYEISVRGGATAASFDDLGFLTIEVNRRP